MTSSLEQKLTALKLRRMAEVVDSWLEQATATPLEHAEFLEQLLSEVAAAQPMPQKPQARPSIVGSSAHSETRRPEPPQTRPNFVSPFAADSARKGTPRQEAAINPDPAPGPRIVAAATQPEPVTRSLHA